jgi:DNA-directed RNA polymerase specialized sigma24 family protein
MNTNPNHPPTQKTITKWIASRARRMGFRGHDIEDIQQQILMVLMDFQFDPEKSNGASNRTAITAVIDRQLRCIRRSRVRYSDRVTGSENIPNEVIDTSYGINTARHISMSEDLAIARSHLSPMAQQICDALADGQSINEIAQQMELSWHTIRKHVDAIRECFASLGLSDLAT